MTGKNKPTHLVAHLHFSPTQKPNKKMQKSYQANAQDSSKMDRHSNNGRRSTTGNSTYKKLAVQCLNEALCFVSSFVVADSLVLRNRQLLVAAKRVCLESIRKSGKNAVQKMEDL